MDNYSFKNKLYPAILIFMLVLFILPSKSFAEVVKPIHLMNYKVSLILQNPGIVLTLSIYSPNKALMMLITEQKEAYI